jgi:hypothetical protein
LAGNLFYFNTSGSHWGSILVEADEDEVADSIALGVEPGDEEVGGEDEGGEDGEEGGKEGPLELVRHKSWRWQSPESAQSRATPNKFSSPGRCLFLKMRPNKGQRLVVSTVGHLHQTPEFQLGGLFFSSFLLYFSCFTLVVLYTLSPRPKIPQPDRPWSAEEPFRLPSASMPLHRILI